MVLDLVVANIIFIIISPWPQKSRRRRDTRRNSAETPPKLRRNSGEGREKVVRVGRGWGREEGWGTGWEGGREEGREGGRKEQGTREGREGEGGRGGEGGRDGGRVKI